MYLMLPKIFFPVSFLGGNFRSLYLELIFHISKTRSFILCVQLEITVRETMNGPTQKVRQENKVNKYNG